VANIHDFHIEYAPAPIEIGGNLALNTAWPGAATFIGTKIETFSVCCSVNNGTVASNTWAVDIGSNFPNNGNVTFS
jgi:hypothetical protein